MKNQAAVAHAWANKTRESGKSGNVFFDGASIFSYGRHFEIARHVVGKRPVRWALVLFNSDKYSSSTAKQQSIVRSAASHIKDFHVPSFEDHGANARYFIKRIEDTRARVLRAWSQARRIRENLRKCIAEAHDFLSYFAVPPKERRVIKGWARRMADGAIFSPEERTRINVRMAHAAAADVRADARRAEWEKQEAANQAAELDAWASHTPGTRAVFHYGGVRLRLSKDGKKIETSRGAEVGRRAAVALWRALKSGRDVVGLDVNGFSVESWDGKILKIGCHDIPGAELERMAAIVPEAGAAE